MNRLEYNLISLKPSTLITNNDCQRLAAFIHDNNITSLPNNVVHNSELFNTLMYLEYDKLLTLNFDITNIYQDIDTQALATYINTYGATKSIKDLIKNDVLLCQYIITEGIASGNDAQIIDLFTPETYLQISSIDRRQYMLKSRHPEKFNMQFFNNSPEELISALNSMKFNERIEIIYNFLKKDLDQSIRIELIELVISGRIMLTKEQYEDIHLTLDEVADAIIKFKNTAAILIEFRKNKELFDKLLSRNYVQLMSTSGYDAFPEEFYDPNIDTLTNLFLNDENALKIFIHPRMLRKIALHINENKETKETGTRRLSEYIDNHPELFLKRDNAANIMLLNDINIFNNLYDLDNEFLFELAFTEDVLNQVTKEKIQDYYKRHPGISIYLLKNSFIQFYRTISKGIDIESLSVVINNALKTDLPDTVYDRYSADIDKVADLVNMSKEDILALFNEVRKKHNADKLIEIFRKAKSISKEEEALLAAESRLVAVMIKYSKVDKNVYQKTIKRRKRQDLYYQYLNIKGNKHNTNDVNESEASLAVLNEMKALTWPIIDNLDQELDEYQFLKIILKNQTDIYIKEPLSYKYYRNQKDLNRLRQNYTKLYTSIIKNNQDIKEYIIKFLLDELQYNEVKEHISKKDITILFELKEIASSAGITINIKEDSISFEPSYQLTKEEQIDILKYEETQLAIKRIKNLMHKHIDILYPANKLDITIEDEEKYKHQNDVVPMILSLAQNYDYIKTINEFKQVRKTYTNPVDLAYFDRLFIDNNFIYCIHPIMEDPMFDIVKARKICNDLLEVAKNIPIIVKNLKLEDVTLDKIEKMKQLIFVDRYSSPHERQILGSNNTFKLVSSESFIRDSSKENRIARIKNAAKYIALATGKYESTVPYLTVKKNGIVVSRYNNNDPDILTTGIDTDSCFKLYGNDNDFLLYTMFDKNGFILKITNELGDFIGRISGFRNGNTIYFNQLRTNSDTHFAPDESKSKFVNELRIALKKYAEELIISTKNSDAPIEHILITKSYNYATDTELPELETGIIGYKPMETTSPDFKKFIEDPELIIKGNYENSLGFNTDYSNYPILVLATNKEKYKVTNGIINISQKDIKSADVKANYIRPRKEVKTYDEEHINKVVIEKINTINAKNIYWGNEIKRKKNVEEYRLITETSEIRYSIIGEDFYIIVYKDGTIKSLCLPYDNRAKTEYDKYLKIISEMFTPIKTESAEVIASNKKR